MDGWLLLSYLINVVKTNKDIGSYLKKIVEAAVFWTVGDGNNCF